MRVEHSEAGVHAQVPVFNHATVRIHGNTNVQYVYLSDESDDEWGILMSEAEATQLAAALHIAINELATQRMAITRVTN